MSEDPKAVVAHDADSINVTLITPPERSAASERLWTWAIALSMSFSYCLTYFWRYPVFVLPSNITSQPVFSERLDLQACISLAFLLGFGLAKPFAASVASSALFFRHRLRVLLTMLTASCFIMGLGNLSVAPGGKVAAVFFSSFCSSWIYGMMITYLEGRRATEAMLAISTICFVYAGNASRGLGRAVLSAGVSPHMMPLVVGTAAWLPACALLVLLDSAPKPSAADVAARCRRAPMNYAAKRSFLCTWGVGIGVMMVAYALVTGIRSVRDLYSAAIFAASLDVETAPSWIFLIADAPGAVLSAVALVGVGSMKDNRRAMLAMLALMMLSIALGLGATALFQLGAVGGVAWQLLMGTSIFVAYALLATPFYERLFAATRTEGTVSFLTFSSDCFGYVVSISLVLYQRFGSAPTAPGAAGDRTELEMFIRVLWGGGCAVLLFLSLAMAYFYARTPG
jgi:hypothetical protein